MGLNLLCDSHGVPLLIQSLKYNYSLMQFYVKFFNGKTIKFTTDMVSPSIDLLQRCPSKMQFLEAENEITKLAKEEWREWFADNGE